MSLRASAHSGGRAATAASGGGGGGSGGGSARSGGGGRSAAQQPHVGVDGDDPEYAPAPKEIGQCIAIQILLNVYAAATSNVTIYRTIGS